MKKIYNTTLVAIFISGLITAYPVSRAIADIDAGVLPVSPQQHPDESPCARLGNAIAGAEASRERSRSEMISKCRGQRDQVAENMCPGSGIKNRACSRAVIKWCQDLKNVRQKIRECRQPRTWQGVQISCSCTTLPE